MGHDLRRGILLANVGICGGTAVASAWAIVANCSPAFSTDMVTFLALLWGSPYVGLVALAAFVHWKRPRRYSIAALVGTACVAALGLRGLWGVAHYPTAGDVLALTPAMQWFGVVLTAILPPALWTPFR
jgi:hypothetical protein